MPIRHQPLDLFAFNDLTGTLRTSVGCPLSCRGELSQLLADVLSIFEANPNLDIGELLEIEDFKASCDLILPMLQIELGWVHSDKGSIIPELLLIYEQDGQVYRNWIESLEFSYRHTKAEGEPPKIEKSDERFSELWFIDCQGQLVKLVEPCIFSVQRMGELIGFIVGQSHGGFAEAYDTNAIVRAATDECLELFGLGSHQVSASAFTELFLTTNHEYRPGQYVLLPGWVQQLCQDRQSSNDGEPLPANENGLDATIAALMSDRYPLDVTMEMMRGVSGSQLRSILRSRSRMIKDAQDDAKASSTGKKKAKKMDAKTKKRLEDEFKRGMPFAMNVLGSPADALAKIQGNGSSPMQS